MGVGPFTITAERDAVVAFTKPYMEEGVGILIKRFSEDDEKLFKIFCPYTWSVWVTISCFVLLAAAALAITRHFSPYSTYANDLPVQKDIVEQPFSRVFTECLWLIYGCYMEQGYYFVV